MSRYDENEAISSMDELWRRTDVLGRDIATINKKKILGVWVNPVLLNSWSNVGGTKQIYRYRLLFSDTLQTQGSITGGLTGTVAYILPPPWRSEKDIAWVGNVVVASTFEPARFELEALTGEVSVHF